MCVCVCKYVGGWLCERTNKFCQRVGLAERHSHPSIYMQRHTHTHTHTPIPTHTQTHHRRPFLPQQPQGASIPSSSSPSSPTLSLCVCLCLCRCLRRPQKILHDHINQHHRRHHAKDGLEKVLPIIASSSSSSSSCCCFSSSLCLYLPFSSHSFVMGG